MRLTRDRNFYRTFFRLFSLIVLQNVIVLSVNLADNIMIGAYSETSLSGVAAVNQLQFIYQQLILGTGDALVTLGSQYWGQGRTGPIKQLGRAALCVGFGAGLVLFALTGLFPRQIVGLFTTSAAIVEEGARYLRIVRYTYLLFGVSSVLLALLRSVEIVRISLWVSLSTLVINCSINYALIGGHLGAPALGVTGAAIGTLVARAVELGVIVCYYVFFDRRLCVRREDVRHWDRALMGDYFRHCRFFLVVSLMFGMSTALQTVILGHVSDSAIAANSIASTLYQVLKVASVGAASATSIIVGKTVGAGDVARLKEYVRTFQWMFLGIGLLTSAALFLLRVPILSLYELSPETKVMAEHFILVLCVTCIGTAYEMPVITGIIRGGGDARFVFVNDLVSIWGIVLPLSFLAAFVFRWDPAVVVLCLNSDQIFKCAAAAIKANRYTWMKKLTRDAAPEERKEANA